MLTRMTSIGSLALLLMGAPPAIAHEDAVLKTSQSSVAAGATVTLDGSDFGADATYQLRLVGALNEYELHDATADAEGAFSIVMEIPRSVRAGQYKMIAVAPDGDTVAGLDLTVLQASRAAAGEASHEEEGAPVAQAGDLPIERSRSGAEWGAIGLAIGLAAGLGISLLRRSESSA